MTAASLFDQPPPAVRPTLRDQIVRAELWVLGIADWLQRFDGTRKRPAEEVARQRETLEIAKAVVETLKSLEQERATA